MISSLRVHYKVIPSLGRSIVSNSDLIFLRRYSSSRKFLCPNHVLFRPTAASLSVFSGSSTGISALKDDAGGSSNLPYPLDQIGPIPEPPPMPSAGVIEELQRTIADSMREIGLASYGTPVGWVQNLLDILHSTTGLPWWQVIALSTLVVRVCTLPIMLSAQRRAGLMSLHREGMEKLMKKSREAQQQGDTYEYQLAMMEVRDYMKEKGLPSPVKTAIPMIVNGFVFMSYFMALRGMTSHSLWSLRYEGLLWFPDLTAADPTFILPAICAVTTLAMIELGVEFGTGGAALKPTMRWFLRLTPVMVLVFGKMMPTAVLCYWFSNNIISLTISSIFLIPKVRTLLKIPQRPPQAARKGWSDSLAIPQWAKDWYKEPALPVRKIKDWRRNRKLSSKAPTAVQIRRTDTKRFKAAGEGPMPATFTFDPKTKYKDVFERKGFWEKVRGGLLGEAKKRAQKRAMG